MSTNEKLQLEAWAVLDVIQNLNVAQALRIKRKTCSV